MADEKERALKVFQTLCSALESHEWHYDKDEENLRINCKAQGEDLPMDINICIKEKSQLILLYSRLPFTVPEDKRMDVAIAVTFVNNKTVDGSFDYNIATGEMHFRLTSSFIESEIGEDLITYMLMCSCSYIDDFNDKFLAISKGYLSLSDFVAQN